MYTTLLMLLVHKTVFSNILHELTESLQISAKSLDIKQHIFRKKSLMKLIGKHHLIEIFQIIHYINYDDCQYYQYIRDNECFNVEKFLRAFSIKILKCIAILSRKRIRRFLLPEVLILDLSQKRFSY